MARPSRQLDQVLLKAGRALMLKGGSSEISIRKVCTKAKVNPGMFVYFFKTKEKFISLIHKDLFEDFLSELEKTIVGIEDPLEQLKSALAFIASRILEQRHLTLNLLRDVLVSEREFQRLLTEVPPRDLVLLTYLIKRCQKEKVLDPKVKPQQLLATFLSVIVAPVLVSDKIEKALCEQVKGLKPFNLRTVDASLERLEGLLKGLTRWQD